MKSPEPSDPLDRWLQTSPLRASQDLATNVRRQLDENRSQIGWEGWLGAQPLHTHSNFQSVVRRRLTARESMDGESVFATWPSWSQKKWLWVGSAAAALFLLSTGLVFRPAPQKPSANPSLAATTSVETAAIPPDEIILLAQGLVGAELLADKEAWQAVAVFIE